MSHPGRGRKSRRSSRTWLGSSTALLSVLALTFVGQDPGASSGGSTARAQLDWGEDMDCDGLTDEVERFLGANPTCADSDYDGAKDGAEWLLGSDLNDAASLPDPHPAIRSCAYEAMGQIRVFCAVFPANLDFVDSFRLIVGSSEFGYSTEGDPGTGLGLFDVSAFLAYVAHSFTNTQHVGLELAGFTIDLDPSLLEESGSLNIGWASKIAGVEVVDQIYLGIEGTTKFMLAGSPTMGSAGSFTIQPLSPVPPPGDEDSEYCKIGLSDGAPVGLASVEFSVTTADCEPDGLLYCIDVDCTALAGQKFVMVDYGYLQSKAQE